MRDLLLDANFENWKFFWGRRQDARFKAVAQKVFERDQFACQYCGVTAKSHLEVINADGNYRNNKSSNLVTACPFCSQCFFLESIGVGSFGGGSLIYLPEISQPQLNALCHVLFASTESLDSLSAQAETILRDFKFRSIPIEKTFGEGMSEAAKFGAVLLNSQLSLVARSHVLRAVRLLPQKSRFEHVVKTWLAESKQEQEQETLPNEAVSL